MKVIIDMELCEGNAVCSKVAPEVFAVGEDDKASLINPNPSEDLRAKIEAAVRRCPRQALSLKD